MFAGNSIFDKKDDETLLYDSHLTFEPTFDKMDIKIDPLLSDSLLSTADVNSMDFDILPDFNTEFNFLDECDTNNEDIFLRFDDNNSPATNISSSDLSENGHGFDLVDTLSPPLTPPSPSLSPSSLLAPAMMTTGSLSPSSSSSSSTNESIPPTSIRQKQSSQSQQQQVHINFNNTTSSINLNDIVASNYTKILPALALKSSRGRSASQDSPDVQALKRHIRMIRNRESASVSRKRKKEYLDNLESRNQELEAENVKLKKENHELKLKLGLVPKPNRRSSSSNNLSQLQAKFGAGKQKNLPGMAVKMTLFALCCFAFVSFAPQIQKYQDPSLSSSSSNNKNDQQIISYTIPNNFNHLRAKRSLLINTNDLDSDSESEVGSILKNNNNNNSLKSDTKFVEDISFNYSKFQFPPSTPENTAGNYPNMTFDSANSKCQFYFNQTEALRVRNDLKGIFSPSPKPLKKKNKKRRMPSTVKPFVYSMFDLNNYNEKNIKGLTLYDEKIRSFTQVLDQIQRKEDTFYVVSLAIENQLLLTAKSHNSTSRPKMSFLLPWKNYTTTDDGKEEFMQIDCEVTQVFNLKNAKRRKRGSAEA